MDSFSDEGAAFKRELGTRSQYSLGKGTQHAEVVGEGPVEKVREGAPA